MAKRLILASKSPRRAELLSQIGVCFDQLDVDIDESPKVDEPAIEYVERITRQKAKAGWKKMANPSNCVVLASDTTVVLADKIMGKPANEAEVFDMLQRLSTRCHQVMSCVGLYSDGEFKSKTSTSLVTFKALTKAEIEAYIKTGEAMDKAGSYAIQGYAAVFIKKLEGSYSGVMGLPLFETGELLKQFKVDIWQS